MSKTRFTEAMAKGGYDPGRKHPEIEPAPPLEYLGKGNWGPPRPPEPDDDGGYGPEDDDAAYLDDLIKG